MPPKPKKNEPSKKTEQKKKEKVIEDKTFGLKNKKGNKQQKFIKMVATQVQHGSKSARQLELEKQAKGPKKDDKKAKMEELNQLFRPVEQKVGKGVDPKSVVCAFFKQGMCTKGDKCKFSHDLNIGRKGEKRSVYQDTRDEDNMEDWDESKLEEVVNKKHGESNKNIPKTSIICKFFLDAVENSKYGWFWECPNGESCHYRHMLPPGFQLKKDKKVEDKTDEISLEELIEKERAALSSKNLTKVTLESFMKWKERKRKQKIAELKAAKDKKKSDFSAGKVYGISGREMFEFNPDLVEGDDDEADDTVYKREEEEQEVEENYDGPVHEIDLGNLASLAQENDGSGTVASEDRTAAKCEGSLDESSKLDMAGALTPDIVEDKEGAISAALSLTMNGDTLAGDTLIDENLFDGEDLDLVEEELDTLDLDD